MKIGIVIPIYNRPEYVKQCFDSLLAADIPKGTAIVLVDDGSNEETKQIIYKFCFENYKKLNIIKLHKANEGVKKALLFGVEHLINSGGCDLIINLDSDAIVKPDFIDEIVGLYKATGLITSGFNNPKEPQVHHGTLRGIKAHANGINMCFNREQYESHIKPALLATSGNWDYMASESAGKVAITIPSCVQHIGLKSSMGHVGADIAEDFKMLSLPDVTLFGIDSHDKGGITRAASISCRDIEYRSVNVITDDLFTKNGSTEQRRKDYSRFMLKELTKHFKTSHVLTIHADGYVLNYKAWDREYLQYDYIGATWLYKDGMNVGNGGFSLRSKKLCDILADQDIDERYMHPEDHCICRTFRKSLETDFGIRFAPEEVANRFSIEAYGANALKGANMYGGQFGFHSSHVDFSNSDIPHNMRLESKQRVQPAMNPQAQRVIKQPQPIKRR